MEVARAGGCKASSQMTHLIANKDKRKSRNQTKKRRLRTDHMLNVMLPSIAAVDHINTAPDTSQLQQWHFGKMPP